MNQAEIDELRADLRNLEARGKLEVIAAVSGISKDRLLAIMAGKEEPTIQELRGIQMLR